MKRFKNHKLCIGLTGGIGAGKSLLSHFFESLEIVVIDADVVARELLAPGEPIYHKVLDRLGDTILSKNQKIDRRALRKLIFTDPELKTWLEQQLHPAVRTRITALSEQAKSPYVILSIPLLVETLPNPLLDRILVITAPESVRLKRIMARDACDEILAQKMMAQQCSEEERLAHADDIIENDGNVDHLKQAAKRLHRSYLDLARR